MKELKLLPKWIMKRYLLLWNELKDREFEFENALKILQKLPKPDDKRVVGLFLSELRKAGWLKVEFHPQDARKRIYSLLGYEAVFNKITTNILNKREKVRK